MKLTNEFTVGVAADRVWDTLLDIERVASFLPGAKVEAGEEPGVFNGSMRVRLGPMNVSYTGTARLGEVDEKARTAAIAVEAKEAKGQGSASAVILNRLVPENGGTRVVAETDLVVTGRQAQFGRGIMQDVASRMLDEFAQRFERHLLEGDAAAPGAGSGGPAAGGGDDDDEVLNLGGVLSQTATARYAGAAGVAVVVVLALIALARGRRRGLEVAFRVRL